MPGGYVVHDFIRIEGLDPSSQEVYCNRLLSSISDSNSCSKKLLTFIGDRTGGNPLFIREMLEILIQQKMVTVQEGIWELSGDTSSVVFTENIRSVYDARLEGLTEEQRVLLKCLSVLGDQFPIRTMYSYLERISCRSSVIQKKRMQSLEGFLKEETTAFRRMAVFSHSLLRDHLYKLLSTEQKESLHLAAAHTLEDDPASDPGELSCHYFQSGDVDSALNWGEKKLTLLKGIHDNRGVIDWVGQMLGWTAGSIRHKNLEYMLIKTRYLSYSAIGMKEELENQLRVLEDITRELSDSEKETEVKLMKASFLTQTGSMSEAKELLDSIEQSVLHMKSEELIFNFFDIAGRFHQIDYNSDKSMHYNEKALNCTNSKRDEIRIKQRIASILDNRGDHDEARSLLEAILKSARAIHAPVLELGVLNGLAKSYFDTGEWGKAEYQWNRGIQLAHNTGNRRSEAMMLNLMGHMFSKSKSINESLEMQQRALMVMEESGNKHGISKVLTDIGILYTRKGDKEKALDNLERSLEIAREMNNKGAIGSALANISNLQKDLGDYELAEKNIIKAIRIWRETGFPKREASCISNRGSILERIGRKDEAIECFRDAIRIGEECGDREGNSQRYGNLAVMMQIEHNFDEAESLYEKAITMSTEIGNTRMMGFWTGYKGVLFDVIGKREQAMEHYLKSMEILRKVGDEQYLTRIMGNYAGFLAKLGMDEEAKKVNLEKLEICRKKGYKVDEASALCSLGHYYRKIDDFKEAFNYYREACLIASEKRMAVHMFRGIMVLYRVLKENGYPEVDEFFPEHWENPEEIQRDSHKPEKKSKDT